jgi:hypothetical protein
VDHANLALCQFYRGTCLYTHFPLLLRKDHDRKTFFRHDLFFTFSFNNHCCSVSNNF